MNNQVPFYPYMGRTNYQATGQLNWVESFDQVNAIPVGPGQTVPFFDTKENKIYVKTTDGYGVPQKTRILRYEDVTDEVASQTTDDPKYVTADEIQELVSKAIDKHYEDRRNAKKARKEDEQ